MTENLIPEIRQLLEEMVLPELKALMAKLEALQRTLELREESLVTQLELLRAEREAFRAEMAASWVEIQRMGEPDTPEPADGPLKGKRGKAGRYLM